MKDYYIYTSNDILVIEESLEAIYNTFKIDWAADNEDIMGDPLFGIIKVTAASKPSIKNLFVKTTLSLK